MDPIAGWLRQRLREREDLNQTALAIQIGVSPAAISAWSRGTNTPGPESCRRLAAFFGVDEDSIRELAGYAPVRRHGGDTRRPGTGVVREETAPYSTPQEHELLNSLRSLSPEQLKLLLAFLESLK